MTEEKTHQEKPSILFVCTAGGARSIFAAGFANQWAKDPDWAIASGFESCRISEPVNRLFEEIGLPAYRRSPKTVFQRFSAGEFFDFGPRL